MPSTDTTPAVRLTVWRPVRWGHQRALLDVKAGRPADWSTFHESVYSWVMQDSVLDAIEDTDQGRKIEAELFETFLPERSPMERGIETLAEKLGILDDILAAGRVDWMDSGASASATGEADEEAFVTPRLNRLLAFRHMLQWVCDTFRDVPGANVTLR